MFKKITIVLGILLIISFVFGNDSLAQLNFGENLGELDGINFTPNFLYRLLDTFACRLFQFAMVITGIMFVIYGIMFFMTRGNPTKMTDAKKALWYGIIGGLVIFGVTTLILSVAMLVGVDYDIASFITCS